MCDRTAVCPGVLMHIKEREPKEIRSWDEKVKEKEEEQKEEEEEDEEEEEEEEGKEEEEE